MKRRGIRATIRTYGVLLQGYTQIEDWASHPAQLKNVDSIWDQLLQFTKASGEEEELNTIPFNSLIKIYGRAEEYQKMYDVYHTLDKKGRLAPDIYTFTILLNAIANRTKLGLKGEPQEFLPLVRETWSTIDDDESANDPTAVAYRNASDARLIWRDLLRTCGAPDSYAIRAMLVLLAKGRPNDQNLALDICYEFLGLAPPGERAKRTSIPIHKQTLNLILSICNNSDRFHHTLDYVRQLISDSKRMESLTTEHMNLALKARAALVSSDHHRDHALKALETLKWMLRMSVIPRSDVDEGGLGPQIRPSCETYDLVALTCFYAKDWSTLSQTFEILFGFKVQEAANMASSSFIRLRSELSGSFVACLLHTAVESEYRHGNTLAVLSVMRRLQTPLSQLLSHPSSKGRQKSETGLHAARLASAISAAAPFIKELAATKGLDPKGDHLFWINKALEYERSELRSLGRVRPS